MNTVIKVFHMDPLEDGSGMEKTHVANVTVKTLPNMVDPMLEIAWVATQNIMGSWSRKDGNPDDRDFLEVVAELPVHRGVVYGLRSSMVGDLMEVDGRTFRVAGCGFEEVL